MVQPYDPAELNLVWEPDCRETRQAIKSVLKELEFQRTYGHSLVELRELTLRRLKRVAQLRVVSPADFETNPSNIYAVQELLAAFDGAVATKFTVQFNLFGGTVVGLGTERHRWLVPFIDTMEKVGCFALTELGYGNNAVEMETLSVWDADTQTFDIHTPRTLASKYWITNGACHAHFCIVFARLVFHGKDEGIHSFLVQIRNEDLTPCQGVEIEDMGIKLGMNGLDNARLRFTHVKVPRTALLNRFADIDESGKYLSTITKKRDRFIKVADRLLSGRICIASMMVGQTRTVAYIGFKFIKDRLLPGASGTTDTSSFDFQQQQLALIPKFARLLALNLGLIYVKERFAAQDPDIIRLCCAIKPLLAWTGEEFIATVRERMGCSGILEVNIVNEALSYAHAAQTAEGDSSVLMLKVATETLKAHSKKKLNIPELKLCPKTQIPALTDYESLDILLELFKAREHLALQELTANYELGTKQGKTVFQVQMLEESDRIQMLARAYGERVVLEQVLESISKHLKFSGLLNMIGHLYALDSIKHDLSWFMIRGLITPVGAENIVSRWEAATGLLKPHVWNIVESFQLPETIVDVPAVRGLEAYYGEHLRAKL
eukprot:CAMPEP_0204898626 /NCGR_PEP_ID=MMETSP1397-20131031/1402_1 /ASSEMBLY_ACC=CAM_ASM_000891 /TAXON_ID=49980 /ORGANISM="Climacostomum Climacostomum virens, Strain Stock W-24" /LENGTH=605 /DNA_ID=CAMNT_0052066509 /DNA_START=307 /DNA_END=2124 /DNA_ORIENTATION=-